MQSEAEGNVLVCPSCSFQHKIRPEMIGKRAKCKCGNILTIAAPAAPRKESSREEAPDDDLYDIAAPPTPKQSAYIDDLPAPAPEPELAPKPRKATTSAPHNPDAAADAAIQRGYVPMHKRVETEDENPPPKPSILLDVILPNLLIPLGVILCFVQAMYFDKGSPKPFSMIAVMTTVSMVASLALVIVAVLGAGAGMGMVFHGPLRQTITKVCAIALIPSALGAMVDHTIGDINGNILGVFTAIGVYLALTKLVLRQPWQETGIIVFAAWVIRALVMYSIYKIQSAQMGSGI